MTPDAWEKVRLGDLGVTYGGLSGKSSPDFGSGDAAYVTFMNVIDNVVLRLSGTDRVRVRPGESQSRLRADDVIFNGSSETPDEVGLGSAVPGELEGIHLNSFCFGFRPHPEAPLDARFFAYLTRSPAGRAVIRPMAQGSTRYNLAKTNLLNGRFLLPPIKEQEAIAEALIDSDAAIEALEALIAKKRGGKQAVMQQLLTGRTRLPGFKGKWRELEVGDAAHVDPEVLGASTPADYTFRYISLENTSQGNLLGWTEERFGTAPSRARRVVKCGDFLFATVRPNLLGHHLFRRSESDWICSTGFAVLRCKPEVCAPPFLSQLSFSRQIASQIEILVSGSNYPAVNSRDVGRLRVSLPCLDEQEAIAGVLLDMDAEIEALVAQREKMRLVKQGMMQELLSGRVRLV